MYYTINPYNKNKLNEFNYITDNQCFSLISVSGSCFKEWRFSQMEQRVKFIKNLILFLTKQQHLLAETCSKEMGKPIIQSIAEIKKCIKLCEYYIEHSDEFLKNHTIITDGKESYVTYEPLGVILGVMPWNFPYWQVFRFAIPTILAGNTVVVKHASNVAGCAELIEKCFIESGFPVGIYQNLSISSTQVETVISNPIIKAVSVTGSEKSGAAVASVAAKNIKKAVLELGGSNSFIVCEDADIDAAVTTAVTARMQNTGQSCIAAKRFLIQKSIFNDFIVKFSKAVSKLKTGDPMEETTNIGPLARIDLAEDLEKQVNTSVEMGAKIVIGGKRRDAFYEPTILVDVSPEMPAFTEELFGPVAAVMQYETLEEAIELSNKSRFGLGVSIFTKNVEYIKTKISLFDEGCVFINAMVKSDPALPFGGIKKSGYGRELAENGIKEFVNIKTVYINSKT